MSVSLEEIEQELQRRQSQKKAGADIPAFPPSIVSSPQQASEFEAFMREREAAGMTFGQGFRTLMTSDTGAATTGELLGTGVGAAISAFPPATPFAPAIIPAAGALGAMAGLALGRSERDAPPPTTVELVKEGAFSLIPDLGIGLVGKPLAKVARKVITPLTRAGRAVKKSQAFTDAFPPEIHEQIVQGKRKAIERGVFEAAKESNLQITAGEFNRTIRNAGKKERRLILNALGKDRALQDNFERIIPGTKAFKESDGGIFESMDLGDVQKVSSELKTMLRGMKGKSGNAQFLRNVVGALDSMVVNSASTGAPVSKALLEARRNWRRISAADNLELLRRKHSTVLDSGRKQLKPGQMLDDLQNGTSPFVTNLRETLGSIKVMDAAGNSRDMLTIYQENLEKIAKRFSGISIAVPFVSDAFDIFLSTKRGFQFLEGALEKGRGTVTAPLSGDLINFVRREAQTGDVDTFISEVFSEEDLEEFRSEILRPPVTPGLIFSEPAGLP